MGFTDNQWAGGSMGADMLGGGSGGPLGSMGMDLSPHKLPLVGSFFQDPNAIWKQQQFHTAAQAYGAYRPEFAQARMNALRNASSAYQGANNLMATFVPGSAGVDATQMYRNPMSPTMMTQGQSITQPAQGFGASLVGSGGNQGLLGGLLGGGLGGGMF